MAIRRVFVGWDGPLLDGVLGWLLERRERLAWMQVVVPTAQAGRRLREGLAERGGAVLAPAVVKPGWFLQDDSAAPDWVEQLAWLVALEEVGDWGEYAGLFPEAPETGEENWARGLAVELARLRRSLQENGLMLAGAARALAGSVEAERWADLARLEVAVEKILQRWGMTSRSSVLAHGPRLPDVQTQLVFAGVPDFPPLLERALASWPGDVWVLVGAPEEEAANFSALGRPLDGWSQRPLPWPDGARGSVVVAADPRHQASEALRLVAAAGTASNGLALGAADVEAGDELARTFTRHGWPAFHPATATPASGIARWLAVWSRWLADDQPAILADLLAMPESARLAGTMRFQLARLLGLLRDSGVLASSASLAAAVKSQRDPQRFQPLLEVVANFQRLRAEMLGPRFGASLAGLLERLGGAGEAEAYVEWLGQAQPFIERVGRDARFWIDMMLGAVAGVVAEPPAGRVVDVQGWLELLHEPGSHLVLCGMNDGRVPARGGGEPWLSEAGRKPLGLVSDAQRAARDAYIYQAMVGWRLASGRVDILCGRGGAGGEGLLPSRLLLAAERASLPARVAYLFGCEVEPPEAGLRWVQDWPWKPPRLAVAGKLAVTKFRDYLACPFRFYLKNVVGMWEREPDRREWNSRDYGSVVHEVLERWGRDPEARGLSKTEALEGWLSHELDGLVAEHFGQDVPLGVAIQVDGMRQRLAWFARVQACLVADGWEIEAIERPFELVLGGITVVGKIDRIDRHRQSGELRVIDYKTGRVKDVAAEHCRKLTSSTKVPQHLEAPACPARFLADDKEYLWLDLQLPLYALAIQRELGTLPVPAYFTVADTAAKVDLHPWNDFSAEHLAAAEACAAWIAHEITAGVFWPPAERVRYDSLAALLPRKSASEAFAAPENWRQPAAPVAVPAAEAGSPAAPEPTAN